MTLYYSLVFFILCLEMVVFLSLIIPLPLRIRHNLFTFLSRSPIVAKIRYFMRIGFVFILILFLDSVNRVYRVQQELFTLGRDNSAAAAIGAERMEVQARKFYSQRNMYLCGFTLFLSLILNRTQNFIIENLDLQVKLKQQIAGQEGGDERARLRKELVRKEKDIQALKEQSNGLSMEYTRVCDELAKHTTDKTPRKNL